MQIFLRPITKDDSDLIVKWRNSPNVSKHCFNRNVITNESHLKFYHDYVEAGLYKQYIVERIEENIGLITYPIATVYLKDIDEANKRCQLCIFTSDDEEWNTESQAIAIKQLLEVAFKELKMHKVYSYVFTKYPEEKELLEAAGFEVETRLNNEIVGEHGVFEDTYRMVKYNQ